MFVNICCMVDISTRETIINTYMVNWILIWIWTQYVKSNATTFLFEFAANYFTTFL